MVHDQPHAIAAQRDLTLGRFRRKKGLGAIDAGAVLLRLDLRYQCIRLRTRDVFDVTKVEGLDRRAQCTL